MASKDKKTTKNKNFCESLKYALCGIKIVFKMERNMRFHLFAAIMVIILSFVLELSKGEWLIIIIVLGLVLFAEIVNSSLERLVDLTTNQQFHPLAKEVKDMAAAGVLIIAMTALVIGIIIFGPKLFEFFLQIRG